MIFLKCYIFYLNSCFLGKMVGLKKIEAHFLSCLQKKQASLLYIQGHPQNFDNFSHATFEHDLDKGFCDVFNNLAVTNFMVKEILKFSIKN